MRNSRQKSLIYDSVVGRFDHPTAYIIYETVRQYDAHISLGTVYRNLNAMVERGELQRIVVENQPDRFDWQLQPHAHIYCEKCKKLFDAKLPHKLKIASQLEGFEINKLQLIAIGKCKECKEKETQCQS